MRVFVTGATGFIGQALTRELMAHGHEVVGLARSDAAAGKLRSMGVDVVRGSVRDLNGLHRAAAEADGVVHLAFTFSPLDMAPGRVAKVFLGGSPFGLVQRMMAAIGATDRAAIDALGSALQGSGRPLVTTFATMGLAGPPGELALKPATEDDAPNPRSAGYARAVNEEAVAQWARRGVRASLVRLAPSVHGAGDAGLIPRLISAARKAARRSMSTRASSAGLAYTGRTPRPCSGWCWSEALRAASTTPWAMTAPASGTSPKRSAEG